MSIAGIAVLTFAGGVAAQEKPSRLLNAVEVQQHVQRGEPGDNARLASHFTALAERYAAEAKRHTSMAQSFVGNPSRNRWRNATRARPPTTKLMASAYRGLPRSPGWAAGAAARCDRLVTLSEESANEAAGAAAMPRQLAGVSR
jgi:hypothetical protein